MELDHLRSLSKAQRDSIPDGMHFQKDGKAQLEYSKTAVNTISG